MQGPHDTALAAREGMDGVRGRCRCSARCKVRRRMRRQLVQIARLEVRIEMKKGMRCKENPKSETDGCVVHATHPAASNERVKTCQIERKDMRKMKLDGEERIERREEKKERKPKKTMKKRHGLV